MTFPRSSRWIPALVLLLGPRADAGCPPAERLEHILAQIDRSHSSRVERFEAEIPDEVYRRAAQQPDEPVLRRDGKSGYAVVFAELPAAPLWKAVNDEDHHDAEGGYFPVRASEVIGGVPRGASRLLFQYFQQWGFGRWWVTRVTVNRELYASSGGRLWETWWVDAMNEADPDRPPIADVAGRLRPIEASRGSWLLAPIDDGCTLVEFYSWSDPGGALGAAQGLMAKKTMRATIEGMVRLAREHVAEPHDGQPFLRPDGTPLEPPPAGNGGAVARAETPHTAPSD